MQPALELLFICTKTQQKTFYALISTVQSYYAAFAAESAEDENVLRATNTNMFSFVLMAIFESWITTRINRDFYSELNAHQRYMMTIALAHSTQAMFQSVKQPNRKR